VNLDKKGLADLAFNGLRSHIKEKLEGSDFFAVNQVHQKALAAESRSKELQESHRHHRPNTHAFEYHSDSSDGKSKDVYTAEFVWSPNDKPSTCASLKPISKNRHDEVKYTFDVSKCDRIFDELAIHGKIKFSHTIPLVDELKRHAYCKLHNTFSHATNDCNLFRRQIQSAINEERLVISAMQVDQNPFPMHAHVLELKNPKALIWPSQAESTKGKNVIIGEERKVLQSKTPRAATKTSTLGGATQRKEDRHQSDRSDRYFKRSDRSPGWSDRCPDRSDRCVQ